MATNDNNELQELKSLISDRFDRLDLRLNVLENKLDALENKLIFNKIKLNYLQGMTFAIFLCTVFIIIKT
jgi:hypothetical protein